MFQSWSSPPPYTPLTLDPFSPLTPFPPFIPNAERSPAPSTPSSVDSETKTLNRRRRKYLIPFVIVALIWLVLGLCILAAAVRTSKVGNGFLCVTLFSGLAGIVGAAVALAGAVLLARVWYLLMKRDMEVTEEGKWRWLDRIMLGEAKGGDVENGAVERYVDDDEEEEGFYGQM